MDRDKVEISNSDITHLQFCQRKLCCQSPGLIGFNIQYCYVTCVEDQLYKPMEEGWSTEVTWMRWMVQSLALIAWLGECFTPAPPVVPTPVSPHYLSSLGPPDFPASDIYESERLCTKIISVVHGQQYSYEIYLRTQGQTLQPYTCDIHGNRVAHCKLFPPWESEGTDTICYCK